MKNGDKASVREVYNLVEEMRKELSGSILRLESKFDLLEAGRLTNLEIKFANLSGRLKIIAIVVSVITSGIFILLNHYLQ